jgi:hypothetical protein
MNTTKDMAQAVADWAKEDENVRVVILTSSRTKSPGAGRSVVDYDGVSVRDVDIPSVVMPCLRVGTARKGIVK